MPLPDELDALLFASLEDHRLSRGERQSLADALLRAGAGLDAREFRRRAFELARLLANDPAAVPGASPLDWVEGVLKALDQAADARQPSGAAAGVCEAHFSPGDACRLRIARLLERAHRRADICVFTITDDRVSGPILDAHSRGVALRILTDNEKAFDEGSDVDRFREAGIPVRIDRTEAHMHHKFALFDDEVLLTGSYNWTRGAARDNHENLIVTGDPRLVAPFRATFEALWERLA